MNAESDGREPEARALLAQLADDGSTAGQEPLSQSRRHALTRRLRDLVTAVVASLRGAARRSRASGGRWVRTTLAYRVQVFPRDVLRLAWFAVRGHGRWIARAWTTFTYGDLRADARAARLSGDAVARRAAQEAIRADARARWARFGAGLRRVAIGTSVLVLTAVVLHLVDSVTGPERTWPWWEATRDLVGDVGGFVREWGSLLVWAAVGGWLIAAAVEGRDRSPGAGWLVRPDRDEGSWVDERMISRALAHLGIAPLNRFFTDGGDLIYPVPARRDGDGTSAQVRLPLGVTADMVAARRSKLAANLGRSSLETWPTKGEEDGILDLWIADKGVLKSGAGRWPLLDEGQEVDVFDGVPFGLSQRGQVLTAPLVGMTWLIGGRPGQGKSSALRTLMLGAALDPTTDMWAFILGESPDFAPFAPRLARYQMGLDDAVAEATTTALEDLLVEMERRGKVLGQQPGSPPKVSRKLADRRALGLHPILCGIDECHELFQHPRFGRRAAELAVRLIKRGRKYGISLLLATQSPTKDSIPREVTRNITCGVAFSVSDQVANDGLLGAGKYAAGIRATDLRITADRGTCVAVGITDEPFELVRTFYIPLEDGEDEVTPVIQRSLALIEEQGRAISRDTEDTDRSESPGPSPDILDDITEIMDGQTRLRTQIVLTRLAELNPEAYEGWTGRDLRTALDSYGIRPAKSGGNMVVRSRDVSTALASRGREEEGEPPGSEGGSPGRSPSQVPPADQGEPQSGRPGTARTAHEQCRPASGSPPPGGRSLPHGPDSA